ncbi:MAG: beta-lactamase family protein [Clostridia bacterium]|nr:beta-lactamase family protein [Clostridia bacterium]
MRITKKGVFKVLIVLLLVLIISITTINIGNNFYVSTFSEENKSEMEIRLNNVVKKYVEKSKFSGSVLVAQGDRIILNEGYGYAKRYLGRTKNTPDTKYVLASMTKSFTASAVMQLQERKMLSLEDKVTKYYPEYKGWEDVTIHNLLNHTSGIENYYESVIDHIRYFIAHNTPEKIISRFKDRPLLCKPGTDFNYSNTNYMILSAIIEKVSGDKYIDYLNKSIFTPSGLVNTGYEEDTSEVDNIAKGYCLNMIVEVTGFDLSNFYGAGGLYSSTEDLYRFFRNLDEKKLLNDTSKVKTNWGYHYGYGMMLNNDKKLGKVYFITGGGPGISTGMYKLVDKNMIIVILSNNQGFYKDEMVADLYDTVNS